MATDQKEPLGSVLSLSKSPLIAMAYPSDKKYQRKGIMERFSNPVLFNLFFLPFSPFGYFIFISQYPPRQGLARKRSLAASQPGVGHDGHRSPMTRGNVQRTHGRKTWPMVLSYNKCAIWSYQPAFPQRHFPPRTQKHQPPHAVHYLPQYTIHRTIT